MTKQRAPFHQLTPDLDDDIERLAAAKGVATMVKPIATPSSTAIPSSSTPSAAMVLPAQREGEGGAAHHEPPKPTASSRGKLKGINLEVPDYVWTDLKIRAAHAQTSVRHIIMKALRANGIVIADDDMIEDGRRLRS